MRILVKNWFVSPKARRLSGDKSYNGGITWSYVYQFKVVSCKRKGSGQWVVRLPDAGDNKIYAIFDLDNVDGYFRGRSYIKEHMDDLVDYNFSVQSQERYPQQRILLSYPAAR